MKKIFGAVAIVLILLVAGFFLLNAYLYAEKQGEASAALSDGTHLGFVRALTDNEKSLDFDDAKWLTGKEGEDAAIRSGICTEAARSECLPNGFFIENAEKRTTRVPVADDARVIMMTWKMEETGEVAPREISLAEFSALVEDPALHWRSLPYQLIVLGGVVTQIEEVYVP